MRPVYEELLHAASRFNLSPTAELKRPTSNLVKIASHVKAKPGDAVIQGDQHTTMTDWLGADCPVDFLNVWFPAHWSPIVLRELHAREVTSRKKHNLWFDAPAGASGTDRLISQRSANLQVEKAEIAKRCASRVKKKWKTRDGIYQLKDPEPSEEDIAETDDTTYAELLREV